MVLHSPKDQLVAEHAKYIQLGLFSVDWIETLRPTASEFPPYADESGLGQTFIIVSSHKRRLEADDRTLPIYSVISRMVMARMEGLIRLANHLMMSH